MAPTAVMSLSPPVQYHCLRIQRQRAVIPAGLIHDRQQEALILRQPDGTPATWPPPDRASWAQCLISAATNTNISRAS
jgi:hypothetical protein